MRILFIDWVHAVDTFSEYERVHLKCISYTIAIFEQILFKIALNSQPA